MPGRKDLAIKARVCQRRTRPDCVDSKESPSASRSMANVTIPAKKQTFAIERCLRKRTTIARAQLRKEAAKVSSQLEVMPDTHLSCGNHPSLKYHNDCGRPKL